MNISHPPLPESFIQALKTAMYHAGDIMRTAQREGNGGEVSGVCDKDTDHAHVNFVTIYDKQVQAYLVETLSHALPHANFLAEEDGADKVDPYTGLCFVIDPIDGTANFIRDYGCSSVSVALLEEGEPILGAVYQPYADELFLAVKGQGTYRYTSQDEVGKRVFASQRPFAEGVAVLGTSPYYKEELGAQTVKLFETFLYHAADVRRSGSAAYDFCTIAAGRTDIFAEARLSPWDYAAGVVLVTEAGGCISQLDGTPLRFDKPCSVLATGQACYAEALDKVQLK